MNSPPDTAAAGRVADQLEIQQLLACYATAVDAKRWELLDNVFFAGSVVDFRANGGVRAEYPAITDYLRDAMGIFAASQHYFMNFAIDVEGDEAGGRFYCLTQMVTIDQAAAEDRLLSDGGYYDAEFVRRADGWRVASLTGGLVWMDGAWPDGVPRPAWYGASTDRF